MQMDLKGIVKQNEPQNAYAVLFHLYKFTEITQL